jgi:hypothetical protein
VPNWLIVEAVGFPLAVIVVVVLGLRYGSRSVSRHPLNNRSGGGPIRASAEIVDAGCVAWPDLLDALAAKQMDPDEESLRDDPEAGENGIANILGLRSPVQSGRFRPNLMYGARAGRQVFIRLGIDETLRSGFGTRRLRQTTVLRVGASSFTLRGIDGVLYPSVGDTAAGTANGANTSALARGLDGAVCPVRPIRHGRHSADSAPHPSSVPVAV